MDRQEAFLFSCGHNHIRGERWQAYIFSGYAYNMLFAFIESWHYIFDNAVGFRQYGSELRNGLHQEEFIQQGFFRFINSIVPMLVKQTLRIAVKGCTACMVRGWCNEAAFRFYGPITLQDHTAGTTGA